MTSKKYSDEWWQGMKELNESFPMNIFRSNEVKEYTEDYINRVEVALESSLALNKAQADRIMRELMDEDIWALAKEYNLEWTGYMDKIVPFVRACIKKAREK